MIHIPTSPSRCTLAKAKDNHYELRCTARFGPLARKARSFLKD